ncbi:putative colanic acid biosynthesis acetyltransferase [Alienimonas sp. DA493]|uniref:putative colanic acid biosynthesis acetyltransferase n=1 Tax=Alienimonas sp. DA493 TaxID=3373605 RepID=UPI003754A9CA
MTPATPPTLAAPSAAVSVAADDCPSPHSLGNKLARVAWGAVRPTLFACSPRPLWGWRRFLLRLFGATVGRGAKVLPSAKIWLPANLTLGEYACLGAGVDCYCVAPISIGDHATVSQRAFLCAATHDVADPHMRLVARPILVEASAWVCAEAFVGPGVTVGEGAVVGARAVAVKDVEPWAIVVGNPARFLRRRELRGRPAAEASRAPT